MNPQQVILVDKNDNFLGYEGREVCHSGLGKRHRAFVTLIFNSKNEVLLQKRRHMLFDGFWDLTAISHPLHIKGRDESYQQASDRALFKEMGITHAELKKIGAFNYFAKDGQNCENEYCAVLVGKYDGKYKANPAEVYDSKWVGFEEFLADVSKNPKKYAPWAVLASKKLKDFKMKNGYETLLSEFLAKFVPYQENYLRETKTKLFKFSRKYDFAADLADFMKGGKKLRAFLVYLGYLCAGGKKIGEVLPACLAFEVVHSFFLIHDDVMDRADLRREKQTVHKKYGKSDSHFGESIAILWGDIAAFEAVSLIVNSSIETSKKQKVLQIFTDTVLSTGWGQALDVIGSVESLSEADINNVNDLKTAKYSVISPFLVGATLALAGKTQLEAIEKFGLYTGRAFQLQDDYLGVFGDEKILGKSVLSDMREGKNTLLIYKTRELATVADRKVIDSVWGKQNATVSDLAKVKTIIARCGANKWCETEMQMLVEKAKKYVKLITSDAKLVKVIYEMTDFIVTRRK